MLFYRENALLECVANTKEYTKFNTSAFLLRSLTNPWTHTRYFWVENALLEYVANIKEYTKFNTSALLLRSLTNPWTHTRYFWVEKYAAMHPSKDVYRAIFLLVYSV